MTTTIIIIALIGILLGYITQAVNTGSLFGQVTVPKPWLPYLTLAASFLGASVTSIMQSTTKDSAAWTTALFAGLLSLGGNTVGVTVKQHLDAHKDVTPAKPAPAEIPKAAANDPK